MNLVVMTGRICNEIIKENERVRITLAVRNSYKKEDEFYYLVGFKHIATYITNYFSKGQKVEIQGHLYSETKNNNYYQNIVIDSISGLEKPKNYQNNVEQNSHNYQEDNIKYEDNNNFSPADFMSQESQYNQNNFQQFNGNLGQDDLNNFGQPNNKLDF